MNYPIGMFGTKTEQQVPLKGVQISARIRDLFCDVTVAQTYENREGQPIEAVYTFPLPLDVVLLDVEVTLGDKQLRGSVVPKQEAEAKYEEAIVSGDAAIRLQRVEPGLYAMNLGNLLAGERAVITFRYGQLLRWNGDSIRFHLPTTVAPRYGVPKMDPHLVPQVSLLVDHAYRLDITVDGLLARADIACPTHQIQVGHRDGSVHVGLAQGQAFMDRDFVLNLGLSVGARSAAVSVADRDVHVALLSWRPSFPQTHSAGPRAVKIVVDCSGSMNGDSIAQARLALKRILESLRPQDYFDIVRFGSQSQVLFGTLRPASGLHLKSALALAESMQADLGGTEIGAALEATYTIRGPADAPSSDVLLITDGEVHDTRPMVDAAKASGHRIFSVGVGASVAEAFVRQLADQTGGACELVHPNEEMAERIVRHFERIFLPKVRRLRIAWPGGPLRQVPAIFKGIFDGDTLHTFAWLNSSPQGEIAIEASLEDGRTVRETIPLVALPSAADRASSGHPVARLATAARIAESPEEMGALALQYQLLTDVTDFLVTHARAEGQKAGELPELRTVPHMLAAGWGGVGEVQANMCLRDATEDRLAPALLQDSRVSAGDNYLYDLAEPGSADWVAELGQLLQLDPKTRRLAVSGLVLLSTAGAPRELIEALAQLIKVGADPDAVVLTFLQELARTDAGKMLSRQAQRVIAKLSQARTPDDTLAAQVRQALSLVLPTGVGAPHS